MLCKIRDVRVKCKKFVSFDVKSLFTNVPIHDAIQTTHRTIQNLSDDALPIPKHDFLTLVQLCLDFGYFEFMGKQYRQIQGLAMGSPLSAVLAQLFMETLEQDHYKNIVGTASTWLRYVDDVLTILPSGTNAITLCNRLNTVHNTIQFTLEEEHNNKLPFLDTIIIHRDTHTPPHFQYTGNQPLKTKTTYTTSPHTTTEPRRVL